MTSAEAARPTLPNIALNALYVACLLWLTELPLVASLLILGYDATASSDTKSGATSVNFLPFKYALNAFLTIFAHCNASYPEHVR